MRSQYKYVSVCLTFGQYFCSLVGTMAVHVKGGACVEKFKRSPKMSILTLKRPGRIKFNNMYL